MSDSEPINWSHELEAISSRVGSPPRRWNWFRRLALRIPQPRWMPHGTRPELDELLAMQTTLRETGQVVWGALLTVAEGALKPGIDDLPAVVMYSWDAQCRGNLPGLVQAAGQLLLLSRTADLHDSQQAQLSSDGILPILNNAGSPLEKILGANENPGESPRERLRRELTAPRHYPVPRALTAMVPMIATTTLLRRLHLPRRRVTNGYLPLWADPATGRALPIPVGYWSDAVRNDWEQAATTPAV